MKKLIPFGTGFIITTIHVTSIQAINIMLDKKVGISLIVFFILLIGIHFGFKIRLNPYLVFLGYILILIIISLIVRTDKDELEENEKFNNWPTSGPVGKYGQRGLKFVFYSTGILCFFNPFQLVQIIFQGIGNIYLKMQKDKMIDEASSFETIIDYSLPFEKDLEWLVYNGGSKKVNSHSWDVVTQRFAYDFVIANEKFVRHHGEGTFLNDYMCYSSGVTAAAPGEVIKVCDGKNDSPFVGYGIINFLTTNFAGNHIIIKHSLKEFSFYAHLKKGSLQISVGDFVTRGQVIAQCGHSGYSSEPHLHFHLQDSPDFYFARGIPVKFIKIIKNGMTMPARTLLDAGDRVASLNPLLSDDSQSELGN